jgi:hypothetical protein
MSTPNEETKAKLVRLPLSLAAWLREEAHTSNRSENSIQVRALEAYREALSRRRAEALSRRRAKS